MTADGGIMKSTGTDELALKELPQAARKCYKFPDKSIVTPLLSTRVFAKAGLTTTFEADRALVTDKQGVVKLEGRVDPSLDLYMAPLNDLTTALRTSKGGRALKLNIHRAANAYKIKAIPALINYYHACLGFPPIDSWAKRIQLGYFQSWPGLTAKRVRKFCTKKPQTDMGYMKMLHQGIWSTQDQDEQARPESRNHTIHTTVLANKELHHVIATDLPGRYPVESAAGYNYFFVFYDQDTSFIQVEPIKTRHSNDLTIAFRKCYDKLRKQGFGAKEIRLDNEISDEMRDTIKNSYNLKVQRVTPGDHRQNPAERAIQTFKAHFIATRAGFSPSFPQNQWNLVLEQIVLTMNLMRPSRINPAISAYAQVYGNYDFMATPIAPAGCKIVVHEQKDHRGSWDDRGIQGFYVGPAFEHYRNFTCWIPETNGIRHSNKVEFYPECCKDPTPSPTDTLSLILSDLKEVLEEKHLPTILPASQTTLRQAISLLQDINRANDSTSSKGADTQEPNTTQSPTALVPFRKSTSAQPTKRTTLYPNGTRIYKRFINPQTNRMKTYTGSIEFYDPKENWYKVRYEDGEMEDLTPKQVREVLRPYKRDTSRRANLATLNDGISPQELRRALIAGAIYDPVLKSWMRYKDLINHPNLEIRNLWIRSGGEKEFGRLFQGYKDTKGKGVLVFIRKEDIPKDVKVTYARYTAAYRPEKADPYRTRITAGGDLLIYIGNTTTHTATSETIKIHWNSVISSPGYRYCTMDCSNMYLESFLPTPQYVRFLKSLIPPGFFEAYGLESYVSGDYVYAKIVRAWYGLKESGKIAHDDLVAHLAKHGYHKAKHTEGLFLHKDRPISFTLVVDDFGIKYKNKEDVEHLKKCLEEVYSMSIDWDGKRYVGIDLQWDYENGDLYCSMPGYITSALQEFKHPPPTQPVYGPSKVDPVDYGAKIQYVKEDTSPPLTAKQIKFIQQVTGKLLFYARAIDPTMLHALNEIAMNTVKGTQRTMAATKHLLNYVATNPDAVLRYQKSDMILHVDSDAAYLVCPEARSRAGGYHYLNNKQGTIINTPIYVLAKVIKNVMASAAEAEIGALFMNEQEAVPFRHCLQELGHPQPPTPVRTDNSTAHGYVNNSIKQKRSKAMDMRFHWLKDRAQQEQFKVIWVKGAHNFADYPTKHHPASHHKKTRPIWLYVKDKSPRTLQGCIELLVTDGRKTAPAQLPRGTKPTSAALARAISSSRSQFQKNLAGASPSNLLQTIFMNIKAEPIASITYAINASSMQNRIQHTALIT